MSINYNKIFIFFKPLLVLFLIAYFISAIAFVFLPKNTVEYENENFGTLTYKEYQGFYSPFSKEVKSKNSSQKKETKELSSYILKAIYAKEDLSGWVIIEEKGKKESLILEQNSKLDDFILTKLFKNYVIFEKNNQEYKLEISETKNVQYELQRVDNNIKEKVIVNGNNINIQRNYLNQYVSDVEKVWNDIAISDYKKKGKLEGFIVKKINKNSVFSKLGLKKGDIIKAINGNKLESYAEAFKVYNNINKIDYINLQIQRDKQLMEINYEID